MWNPCPITNVKGGEGGGREKEEKANVRLL